MDEPEVRFTKNKRLIEKKDMSHIGGSVRDKKSLIKNMSDEEEYQARKAFEHQQDINDAFDGY